MEETKVQEPEKAKKKAKKAYDVCNRVEWKGMKINRFLNFLRVVAVPFIWLFKPYKFYGNKKIKPGAGIYVVNHYGLLDIVYPSTLNWEGLHYIAKREIEENPLFNFLAKHVKAIKVNRDGSDVRGMLDSLKCLKNNEKICIFPEGTRNKSDEEFLPFKGGAAMLAIKAKAPIIPVLIYKRPKFFQMAHIVVGDPFEFTEYYGRKLTDEDIAKADAQILELMKKLRADHTEFLAQKKKKK
jgi:1-acyl-sn-glycerol-3-phosphate acyltransferase